MIALPVKQSAYFEITLVRGKRLQEFSIEFNPDLCFVVVDSIAGQGCGGSADDYVQVTLRDGLDKAIVIDAMIRSDSAKVSIFACAN